MSIHNGPLQFLKGAIVILPAASGKSSTILFQYNPENVQRSLQPQVLGGEPGQQSPGLRYTGAPVETIKVEVLIDAADQLEKGDSQAADMGIYPQLAALEMLAYPQSQQVTQNNQLLAQGLLEIGPYPAPLTLFVWGRQRSLPVRLTSFAIQEQIFGVTLNPLRATVSLEMRALSYSELDQSHQGYHLFLAYQQAKERMAQFGRT